MKIGIGVSTIQKHHSLFFSKLHPKLSKLLTFRQYSLYIGVLWLPPPPPPPALPLKIGFFNEPAQY